MLAAQTAVDSPARLRALAAGPVEWQTVLEHARAHGVTPLVAETLATHCAEMVPDEILQAMRAEHQQTAKRNLRLTQELCAIVDRLQTAGIDAVPYRGPVLAADAYGDLGRRQFTDIDLLVRRADIPDVRALLTDRGYAPAFERRSTTALTAGQECAYALFRRDYPFYRAETDTEVELHWRVLDRRFPTAVELGTVWDRRASTMIAGRELPVPSTEDRLFMLCIHGTRHYWERLEWLCDVRELLERERVDWDAVLGLARSFDAERMFLLGPAVVAELYGTELPDRVRRQIERDDRLDGLRRTVLGRLFEDTATDELSLQQFQARTLDRRRDAVRLAVQWLFTPTRAEIETLPLPRSLIGLYVLYRPLHLLSLVVARTLGLGESPATR